MPRIIINPDVFHDKRDALAVAFNEGLRVFMETRDFEPEAEPTEEQRKFFSDTPYADDETMLRRTILARIATFDTSVKDPTADQIAETAQVLRMVLESDFTKTPEERAAVKRLFDAAQATLEKIGGRPLAPKEEEHGEHEEREEHEEHGEEEHGESTEAPTADAILSAYGRRAAMKGGDTAPSAKLVTFLKKHEKYAAKAYKDVGGYAVGYGAHTVNGKAVTEGTTLSAADADAQLARDIGVREQRLSGMLPGWSHFDRDMKDAVIQAAFGNDDMFTAEKSPNLHRKLTEAAALKDPTTRIRGLADALYDELPTYTRANGEVQPGLEARQLDARDTFLAGTGRRRAAEEAMKQAALDKEPLNEV